MRVRLNISKEKQQALEELGVGVLFLFGSRAQDIAKANSDYDIGLLMTDSDLIKKGNQELYQAIFEILSEVIGELVNIDIVFLDRASLQLCYHVVKHGKVIFETNPNMRVKFFERVIREHADFEEYRKLFEETTLKRIA
ncbi:MAG: nucleotidyltransferase domain-containing protein [Pseudomonadota bacterium]